MRRIDADAMEAELMRRVRAAEAAGDGQAAGMFFCMLLIMRDMPTVPAEGGEDERNVSACMTSPDEC